MHSPILWGSILHSPHPEYRDIEWEALSYSDYCEMIQGEKGNVPYCRKRLANLGEQLKAYLNIINTEGFLAQLVDAGRKGGYDKDNPLIGCIRGLAIAASIETHSLGKDNTDNIPAVKLRQMGITSLDELANVLTSAQNSEEFDRFTEPLEKFFRKWHEIALHYSHYGYRGDFLTETELWMQRRRQAAA